MSLVLWPFCAVMSIHWLVRNPFLVFIIIIITITIIITTTIILVMSTHWLVPGPARNLEPVWQREPLKLLHSTILLHTTWWFAFFFGGANCLYICKILQILKNIFATQSLPYRAHKMLFVHIKGRFTGGPIDPGSTQVTSCVLRLSALALLI